MEKQVMDMNLPVGFRFSGIHCGIKAGQKKDLSLIVADRPAFGFGVFTQNLVRAACIDWNRELIPSQNLCGIVINSGNANACTGTLGRDNNQEMAGLLAHELSRNQPRVNPSNIAVLSTGVIGRPLPMERLRAGIPQAATELASDQAAFSRAAEGILTTDHATKSASRAIEIGEKKYSLAAMVKGAGMIGPNMATMLGVVVTDFPIVFSEGQRILQRAADHSFNRISVEGHTSTNDAVLLMSPSGEHQAAPEAVSKFEAALHELTLELAKRIPADGEGASHLIHIAISGAGREKDAEQIARTIALSNLVKTAISGADPNWGRIVSAAGYAGVPIEVEKIRLVLNGILLFENGQPVPFNEREVSQAIRGSFETEIELSVGSGTGRSDHWTSDLTADYVKLNAEYTT